MNQDSGSVAGADSRTDQEEELGAAGAITVRPRSSIRFNLNWIEGSAGAPTSDLDIGCLFVLADGRRGAVQSVDRLDRSDGGLTSVHGGGNALQTLTGTFDVTNVGADGILTSRLTRNDGLAYRDQVYDYYRAPRYWE